MHVIAAKAAALRLAATEAFRADQRRTVENARVLAETLAELGARVVSGGTDNHLMLVDVTPLGVTGKEAEAILDAIGITVNKNAIPFDINPPLNPSGIRLGSPAVTTRGFGEGEMRAVAELIDRVLADLRELGYVDDAALARALAARRLEDGWGALRVEHDLERLGIGGEGARDAKPDALRCARHERDLATEDAHGRAPATSPARRRPLVAA
jgi:glycine/serine hydroxymethyltransferase